MISNTLKSLQDQNEIIDLSMIKKFMKILSILLIIFTIIYFTCFGCFLVLNNTVVQTVTLSSEGPAYKTYPDSMGEYQLLGGDGSLTVYGHVKREDRFLMYNKLGNIEYYFNILY